MKVARWIDEVGYMRVSIVRDDDNTLEASHGLKNGPPDVIGLDWDSIVRDLHNNLVGRELFTYKDILTKKDSVTSAILSTLRRRVIELYKQHR